MRTDNEIFKDVTEKLEFDPRINNSNVTVAVKEGIVTLMGRVFTYPEKSIVEEDVKNIRGVKGVAEELEVSLYKTAERTDADIAAAVRNALEWHVFVPEKDIQVVVEEGIVTLTGEVPLNYQRERASSAVRNLWGVKSIINRIKVKPKVNVSDVKSKIVKEFERNARIDATHISVEAIDSKVILRGSVPSWVEHDEAATAAWLVPGVTSVENFITVEEDYIL
ncbi:MAG: BON domain-containing protein [Alphaproteobacteria bacterium]|nr:BON domain-containing protein [Alphaproteobacteria bacterium]